LSWNRFGAALVLALCPAIAAALDSDRLAPVQIRAERIDVDQKTGISHYQGQVRYQQGSMRMDASSADVTMARPSHALVSLKAEGRPARFRTELEQEPREVRGEARRLAYDAASGELQLQGAARLERGTDVVTAGHLRYDTRTDHFTAVRDGTERIHAHYQPPARNDAAPAAPKPGPKRQR